MNPKNVKLKTNTMTQKIKIRDVKTGKISEVTPTAWDLLKKGGHAKNYDLIDQPTVKTINAQINAPTPEPATTVVEAETIPTPEPEPESEEESGKMLAAEVIEKINAAATVEEIDALLEGESRSTVLKAAQRKKAELK